ncbi:MAG: hypothetical protein KJ646_03530 [Nanoarchaeota archaeon]|nr:hypothetical protein [Nanoarchaeota archaeon]MBU4116666.1 hypothetical protein [Nanoarchaeota archaeon]
MTIFFISGAEGVGKTTILGHLIRELPDKDIHDFDEIGVPKNPKLSWRYKTTKHWLKIAKNNEKIGKDTIIVGLSFPSEIIKFSKKKNFHFCLFDISINEREKRLRKRKSTKGVIDDLEQLKQLREEFKKLKSKKIINISHLTPKEISSKLIKWINSLK